ncbi:MAG: DUF5682 family protein [Chloroflexota bacterium]
MLTLFPIRHHGPGSAFALVEELNRLKPDIVLIEGSSDANHMLHWLGHAEMEPPVALLGFRPDEPGKSSLSPFSTFSPEYNAIRYALDNEILVRFCDLPLSYLQAAGAPVPMPDGRLFQKLAKAAGTREYEPWWNIFFEQRQNMDGMFDAINLLIAEMRSEHVIRAEPPVELDLDEKQTVSWLIGERREAMMRQGVRDARAEGYQNIVFVCGAWHAPAILQVDEDGLESTNAEIDGMLLEDLPSVEIEFAWMPWTYGRLSTLTGYGAGVKSPGWYHHLWNMRHQDAKPIEVVVEWVQTVAQLLREQGFDASSAHIIETARLAEALAAVRNFPMPSLPEIGEAVQTVMCGGHSEPLKLIQRKLIVGERMGQVPADVPLTPFQKDLWSHQKRFALYPEPEKSVVSLDLRRDEDREKSAFLHRLNLLGVAWGVVGRPKRQTAGTSAENWTLKWVPDLLIKVLEAAQWGNTVHDAALASGQDAAGKAQSLKELTTLLNRTIEADLPDLMKTVLAQIEERSAVTHDVIHMMDALPPLARIMRYGDVRQTDRSLVGHVVETLLTRICINLPTTCAAVDLNAAQEIIAAIGRVQPVIGLVSNQTVVDEWHKTLAGLLDARNIHGLIGGTACRLLFQSRWLTPDETAVEMGKALKGNQALSVASTVAGDSSSGILQKAFWLDGFLRDSELVLVHDKQLWNVLDHWVIGLDEADFHEIMSLLRRVFSEFSEGARNALSRRVKGRPVQADQLAINVGRNADLADEVLIYLEKILI